MNEKKNDEWVLNNWFKASIIVLFSVTIFLLAKYFVFTPEAAYKAKKQECLLLVTKLSPLVMLREVISSNGEVSPTSTEQKFQRIADNLFNELNYTREYAHDCLDFLEAENIDYPARYMLKF